MAVLDVARRRIAECAASVPRMAQHARRVTTAVRHVSTGRRHHTLAQYRTPPSSRVAYQAPYNRSVEPRPRTMHKPQPRTIHRTA
eukprot:3561783-Rhodomonas_salina.1